MFQVLLTICLLHLRLVDYKTSWLKRTLWEKIFCVWLGLNISLKVKVNLIDQSVKYIYTFLSKITNTNNALTIF